MFYNKAMSMKLIGIKHEAGLVTLIRFYMTYMKKCNTSTLAKSLASSNSQPIDGKSKKVMFTSTAGKYNIY